MMISIMECNGETIKSYTDNILDTGMADHGDGGGFQFIAGLTDCSGSIIGVLVGPV